MLTIRSIIRVAALILVPSLAAAQSQRLSTVSGRLNEYGNPEKRTPRATSATITAEDLMTRIYIFADDSMEGRNAPLESNARGNAYIVRELTRLGLRPAGDFGTYLQVLPYVIRTPSPKSSLATTDGTALTYGSDFTLTSRGNTKIVDNAQVIYGGVLGDTAKMISAEQAANRFVIVTEAPGQAGGGRGRAGGGRAGGAPSNAPNVSRYAGAVGIATIRASLSGGTGGAGASGSGLVTGAAGAAGGGRGGRGGGPSTVLDDPRAVRFAAAYEITPDAAARLLGKPVDLAQRGDTGKRVDALVVYDDTPVRHAANVVALIPGSDPVLKNEIVAIGSHNDHVGITPQVVDHDSTRAAALMAMRMRIRGNDLDSLPQSQRAAIRVNVDSLRRIRPARRDSIRNGADDDGSGSMAMLEIAEAIQRSALKPKRSLLFVWHTAEEDGLTGSRWFTDNPTVPLPSIVAQINMDMIGRGRAEDVPGGGPDYLGIVGANRLSSELGARVDAVNARQTRPLRLDDRFDRTLPPTWREYNNIYGRSDHANYSRYDIPIVFFFTGLHADYHQVTDEPQYIDYPHYARITQFVHDLTVDVANLAKRPSVDRSGAPPR